MRRRLKPLTRDSGLFKIIGLTNKENKMHEHSHCQHNLSYCEHCDVVYCSLCKREWQKPCTQNHYPYMYWYNHTWPSAFTNTGNVVDNTPVVTCNHLGN